MGLEREAWCPSCDATRTFYLTARTTLHLGMKRKWTCTECDYRVVRIADAIDTSES